MTKHNEARLLKLSKDSCHHSFTSFFLWAYINYAIRGNQMLWLVFFIGLFLGVNIGLFTGGILFSPKVRTQYPKTGLSWHLAKERVRRVPASRCPTSASSRIWTWPAARRTRRTRSVEAQLYWRTISSRSNKPADLWRDWRSLDRRQRRILCCWL